MGEVANFREFLGKKHIFLWTPCMLYVCNYLWKYLRVCVFVLPRVCSWPPSGQFSQLLVIYVLLFLINHHNIKCSYQTYFILQECPEYIESKFVSYVIFFIILSGEKSPSRCQNCKNSGEFWMNYGIMEDKQPFLGP